MLLGNDIVDLVDSQTFAHPFKARFLKRVYSVLEQDAIKHSQDANKFAWAIWAAKEAAFKSHQKINPALIFKHQEYRLSLNLLSRLESAIQQKNSNTFGKLFIANQTFYLTWQITNDYIHCASYIGNLRIKFTIQKLSHAPKHIWYSTKEKISPARAIAKNFLYTLGFDQCIEIIRNDNQAIRRQNPPYLCVAHKMLANEISLSHDGEWAAIAVSMLGNGDLS